MDAIADYHHVLGVSVEFDLVVRRDQTDLFGRVDPFDLAISTSVSGGKNLGGDVNLTCVTDSDDVDVFAGWRLHPGSQPNPMAHPIIMATTNPQTHINSP
jgi:hypothetical protein